MMNLKKPLTFAAIGCFCMISSCSTMQKVGSKIKVPKMAMKAPNFKMPKFKKPSFAFLNPKNFSLKALRAGKRVPIVDVREKDLKTAQTGEQLYLAYNQKKKKYGYYSGKKGKLFTPVDFDPGSLPQGDDPDFPTIGLLPSLSTDGGSYAPSDDLGDLPSIDLPEIPEDLKLPEDLGVPGTPDPGDLPPPVVDPETEEPTVPETSEETANT